MGYCGYYAISNAALQSLHVIICNISVIRDVVINLFYY